MKNYAYNEQEFLQKSRKKTFKSIAPPLRQQNKKNIKQANECFACERQNKWTVAVARKKIAAITYNKNTK